MSVRPLRKAQGAAETETETEDLPPSMTPSAPRRSDKRLKARKRQSDQLYEALPRLPGAAEALADSADGQPSLLSTMIAGSEASAAAMRRLRRKRAMLLLLRLLVGIGIPTAISCVYNFRYASDVYESNSLFTIKTAESDMAAGPGALLGGLSAMTPSDRDTLAVRDYILSRDMVQRLDREHGLTTHFSAPTHDWLSRLSPDAPSEEVYDYYQDRVELELDIASGVLTMSVRAYDPTTAHQFSEAILQYSETMVNEMAERVRNDQIRFAESELGLAEERLKNARSALLALQSEREEFNPQQTANEAMSVRGQLQGRLATVRAELSQALSYMSADAPKVVALRQEAASLSGQIANETRRLVNPKTEGGLAESMATFEAALTEKQFAESSYESALKSLETARVEANRQHNYLVRVAQPSEPNSATYPKRWLAVLKVLLLSTAILGVASLLLSSIREHAKF